MEEKDQSRVLIISAPSGAGKSTLVNHLLASGLPLAFSVSATSRKPRGSETDGREYYFLSAAEFRGRIRRNEFVEWQEVYRNRYYGTLRSELERIAAEGKTPLFDVDVKGGINLKKIFAGRALAIFIMPPSVEELRSRLTKRGTDSEEDIEVRVQKAASEILLACSFDRVIINDDLEKSCKEITAAVKEFLGLR
mgnify:FL=1